MKTTLLAACCAMTLTTVGNAQARQSKLPTATKLSALEKGSVSTLRNVMAWHEGEIHVKKLAPNLVLSYSGRRGFTMLKGKMTKPPGGGKSFMTFSRESVASPEIANHPAVKNLNVAEVGRRLKSEAKQYTNVRGRSSAPAHWTRSLHDYLEIEKGIH